MKCGIMRRLVKARDVSNGPTSTSLESAAEGFNQTHECLKNKKKRKKIRNKSLTD